MKKEEEQKKERTGRVSSGCYWVNHAFCIVFARSLAILASVRRVWASHGVPHCALSWLMSLGFPFKNLVDVLSVPSKQDLTVFALSFPTNLKTKEENWR